MALTAREHGHLDRLRERLEILRAKTKDVQPLKGYMLEWHHEANAIQWAIEKLDRHDDIQEKP